jgi:hypothetical protein
MQYATLFNTHRAVYFSSYSEGDSFFDQRVRAHKGIIFSSDWYPFVAQGKWESPLCGFGILKGDWHAAADLYREHMAPVFKAPEVPAWLRETFHGMFNISLKGGENPPVKVYTDIPKYFDHARKIGLDTVHFFSWHEGGMDALYPDYLPSPYLGPPSDLKKSMNWARERGFHSTLYTNARLLDPASQYEESGAGPASYALKQDGSPHIEVYNRRNFRAVCPFAPVFQDHFVDVFRRMITEYHAQGAQIDMLSCNPAPVCYSEEHGHSTPANGAIPGQIAILKRLREMYRELDPDFFVWSEGCSELFGQYCEVNQGHGEGHSWTSDLCMPEQFHYTYPDFLTTGGADTIEGVCQTYGQGKPFHFHENRLRDEVILGLIRDLVQVRKMYPEYFLTGRFTDTVGLQVGTEGLRYWGIRRTDKTPGILVNLWSMGAKLDEGVTGSLRNPHPEWKARLVYPADLKVKETGEWLELDWTAPLATVVFEPEG